MSGGKGNSKAQTSSSTTTNTSQTTVNTVDNRAVQGDNALIGGNVTANTGEGSQVSVQQTDLGAIGAGLDIALESLGVIRGATTGAYQASKDSLAAVKSVASDSITQAYGLANQARQSETSGAINQLTKYVFWIALAGVAAYAIVKLKK